MKTVVIAGASLVAISLAGGAAYVCCTNSKAPPAPIVQTAAAPATEAKAEPKAEPKADADAPPPWLKKVPGVKYTAPKGVSKLLYKKYQSFDESFERANEGGGEFVSGESGSAYKINAVDPESSLSKNLGLRPGDKVISINGQPVAKTARGAKALYEGMKNETRFSVLVEREGQLVVLSYTPER